MPESKQSPCALCDNTMARLEFHDSDRIRYYHCPKCHEYLISKMAISHLAKNPESKRKLARKAADTPHSTTHILEITIKAGNLDSVTVLRQNYSL